VVAHNTIHGSSNPVERPEPVVNIGNGHKVALAVCGLDAREPLTAMNKVVSDLHQVVVQHGQVGIGRRPDGDESALAKVRTESVEVAAEVVVRRVATGERGLRVERLTNWSRSAGLTARSRTVRTDSTASP
jgi:hypothetical protein